MNAPATSMRRAGLALWLIAPVVLTASPAAGQDITPSNQVLECSNVPTYFPKGDHWTLWPGVVAQFRPQADGHSQISGTADLDSIARAFQTWNSQICDDGYPPNFRIQEGPTYPTRDRGDTQLASGAITFEPIVYFVESNWGLDGLTVAVTHSAHLKDTGRIVDADIEINAVDFQWRAVADGSSSTVGCTASSQCYDVETVVLHEAGHFIGLDHVNCADAVMFPQGSGAQVARSLSNHERTGLCSLYPPRPANLAFDRYFGEGCSLHSECSTGLCVQPATLVDGSGWGWCAQTCDCTDGCPYACPVAYECVRHTSTDVRFCRPGVHLTGGSTVGSCPCDSDASCSSACVCDQDCVSCNDDGGCAPEQVCRGGVCTSCTATSDCASGKVCASGACVGCSYSGQCIGGKVCLSGACGDCRNNDDCPQGDACVGGACKACTANTQCTGGQICLAGECSACTASTQCGAELACRGGACTTCINTAQCANGRVCLAGSCIACSSTTQCLNGRVCKSGACVACSANTDCANGHVCSGGACQPCTSSGQCTAGGVCAAGACVGCTTSAECAGQLGCVAGGCAPCTTAGHCVSGQQCNAGSCSACGGGCTGGDACVAGVCQACTASSQCGAGEICTGGNCTSCTNSAQCSDGQICSGGSCGACTSSSQCSNGQYCASGECTACSSNSQCGAGAGAVCISGACGSCSSSTQCDGGLVCNGGACSPCTAAAQCSGLACVNGACTACSTSSQCADNRVCDAGACQGCTASGQCDGGGVCEAGACRACANDGECAGGLTCRNGGCLGCTALSECNGGQICDGGLCTDCTADAQCGANEVCFLATGRCGPAGGSGDGGAVDPETGLAQGFCEPCSTGSDCASGVCVSDGSGNAICTHACYSDGLSAEEILVESCSAGFDCLATGGGWSVCWPQDMADCTADEEQVGVNALCFDERGPGADDDWFEACDPGLACFAFRPRCEGKQGACVLYCNESTPCPDANQECCYGVDDSGTCMKAGAAGSLVHGGCFDIRHEGESCVAAEQSVCAAGLGCFHFGDSDLAKCYAHCDRETTCRNGASCTSTADDCGTALAMCCSNEDLPDTCTPGVYLDARFDLGVSCATDDDCDSELCAARGDESVCSRYCNATTGVGCPMDTYDADGDGIADGGYECIRTSGHIGYCWPSRGPIQGTSGNGAQDVEKPDPPPPPKGLCGEAPMSYAGLWGVLGLWLLRTRRRHTRSVGAVGASPTTF